MKDSLHDSIQAALDGDDTVIKFKDSLKKVLGIERPPAKGLGV